MRGPSDNPRANRRNDERRHALRRRQRLAALAALAVVVVVIVVLVIVGFSGTNVSTSTTTSSSTSAQPQSGTTYSADLSGGNEIPPVSTAASGTLALTVAADGLSVHYVLKVSSIISLTVARLHVGKAGVTGGTILTIYSGPTKSGLYTGTIAQGSFAAKSLGGSLKGKTVKDLVTLLKSESVYINVGTTTHSQGEIRGQLQQAQ